MYLSPAEYKFIIRQDVLTSINDGSTTRLEKAEKAAAKFMISHLSKRFDVAQIFFIVSEYNQSNAYVTGQMVYWKDASETDLQKYQVYEATQAIPASTNPSDPLWALDTKRDELVMMYLADITAWNFFAADGPVMNETIKERYKEAKNWVKGVSTGDMIADLPPNTLTETDADFNSDIRGGSKEYEDNSW